MKNMLKWSTVIATAVLAGCAKPVPTAETMPGACPEPAPQTLPTIGNRPCALNHCWINVAVEQEPYPSCKRYVTVEVGKLQMAKKNQATIHWILTTVGDRYELRLGPAGQEYTGGSVWFKPPSAGTAPGQFSVPALAGPRRITMFNSNTNSVTYDYGVRVYDTKNPPDHPRPVDPAVINDF